MIFYILNKHYEIIDSITLYESKYDVSFESKVTSLIKATLSEVYVTNTLQGSINHKFYVTAADLYDMQRLFAYQESYRIAIIERSTKAVIGVYFNCDFMNSKLNKKDGIDRYEFDATLLVTGLIEYPQAQTDDTIYQFPNEKFLISAANKTAFTAAYPKFSAVSNNYGTISVVNGRLTFRGNTASYINYIVYNGYTKYQDDDFTVIFRRIKIPNRTDLIGSDTDFRINLYFDADYGEYAYYAQLRIATAASASTYEQRIRFTSYRNSPIDQQSAYVETNSKNILLDIKAVKTTGNVIYYYKFSNSDTWIQLPTLNLTSAQFIYFYMMCVGDVYGYSQDFSLSSIEWSPNLPKEVSA